MELSAAVGYTTIHQGTCEVPDDEAETCDGVRVWELPC
jgi:hypothetical protein